MSDTPVTGLLPRREETREMMASEQLFKAEAARETVVQEIAWIRDQLRKPSCVGQAFAAGVDVRIKVSPWCSAVDVWRDARRRQGSLESVMDGTRAEYAIASLINRGFSPYKKDEDARDVSKDDDSKGTLADEMFAHDKRQIGVVNYDISVSRIASIIAALKLDYVVGIGVGVRDPFYRPPYNKVLGPEYLGGNSSGHEMRIFGYVAERKAFVLQNSWGIGWGGVVVEGIGRAGCCLVSEEVIEEAWDIDALEIVSS